MNIAGTLLASVGVFLISLLDNVFRGGVTFTESCVLWNVLYWSYVKFTEE